MPKYADKIAKIEKKIEQERQQLRDLKARETAQKRRDDTRRKILYGAAILSLMEKLPADKKRDTMEKLHQHIRNEKDRVFLGLPTLQEQKKPEGDDARTAASGARHGNNQPSS